MKCEIKTFSPVHIGTGEEIYPFDYVVDGEYYIRYRLEDLVEQRPSRANDLVREVEKFATRRKGEQFSLNGFLTNEEIWIRENWDYSGFVAKRISSLIIEQLSGGFQADLFDAIKTVQDELYIPGSSIKGSIRNSIAYSYLKNNPRLLNQIKDEISEWLKSRRKDNIGELTIEVLFRGSDEVKGIHSDLLKALSVSDTQPISPDENMGLSATKTVSIGGRYDYKTWWNFCEVILEDRVLPLDISFNKNWLEDPRAVELLGWDNLLKGKKLDQNFIINSCNDFAADLIDYEINFYEEYNRQSLFDETLNFYYDLKDRYETLESNECILRLGKGTGWTGLTAIGLHIINDRSFDIFSYRRKTNLGRKQSSLFPKSRVVDAEKDQGKVRLYWPLGWIILSFEENYT